MKKILFAGILLMIFAYGCAEKAPVAPDGEAKMLIKAYWNSSTDSIPNYLPMANAQVILTSEYGVIVSSADNNGVINIANLPSSVYSISVRMTHPNDPDVILIATMSSIETFSGKTFKDTVCAKPYPRTGITINEIYVGGPSGTKNYFYDQFIELYNSGQTTRYLDGMMVMRFSENTTSKGHKGPGADEGDDGDIDGVTYAFKFPGNPGEKNYPFPPKKFLVLALVAIDHRSSAPQSIDLSKADWEFYNQFSAGEMDNPNVPNLINMRTDSKVDFYNDLQSGVIILSSGSDTNWSDGIDINSVIDGIEYRSTSISLNKTLDPRVDKSFVISPPKYSGQSMQRRSPGVDTNDSNLDWEIIPHPTPGYQ